MKALSLLFISILILSNCKNLPTNQSLQENLSAHSGIHSFGATIDDKGTVAMEDALTQLQDVDSLALKVTGKVTEVCQAKGCWMNVVSENGESVPMFVKFKDYGFFMPKDCAGKKVVMDGVAYKEITSVEELRHYAEDKGASKEDIAKITTPKEELKFMASGVLLFDK